MELRGYLRILQRRWPVLVLVPLFVLLFAGFQAATHETVYTASARAMVMRHPDERPTDDYQYDNYYNMLTSEFAIDDLVEALRGDVFAEAVAEQASANGTDVGASEVESALAIDRKHRALSLDVSSTDPERARAIADAAATVVEQQAFDFLGAGQIGSEAVVRVIDRPGDPAADTLRTMLLLALEIMAGIGLGVLLAFLIDYLDDRIYDADNMAVVMGVPHLATIPVDERR